MIPTNGSVIELFERAINDLPPELASISRDRIARLLESPGLSDTLNTANSTAPGQQILMSLPRVLATSKFISHTLHQAPDLLESLLSTDSVLVPRDQKDIGKLLLGDYTLQTTVDQLMLNLRNIRRREVVRIGWRDIAGFASLNEVVETLSHLADECIEIALNKAQYEVSIQHGAPIGADSHENIGLVVLGLGKLGGRELNFSSDVDLIFAYPESGTTNGHRSISNQEFFIKAGQLLIRILDETTPDGFVFRTDMRLRPNGDSGPFGERF